MNKTSHVVPCSSMGTKTLSATGDMLERNAEIRALIEAGELVGSAPHALPGECLHPTAVAMLSCRCQTHWLVMLFLISFSTLRRAMAVGCS